MSSNGNQPVVVSPGDVEAEQNWIRQIENSLGLDRGDPDYDDTAMAAIIQNTATIAQVLGAAEVDLEPNFDIIVENVTAELPPDTDLGLDDLDRQVAIGIAKAEEPILHRQLYNQSTADANDNILSKPLQPKVSLANASPLLQGDTATFRVTVSLDTTTTFTLVTDPEESAQFTSDFFEGDNLSAGARYEFEFDADPNAEYNFRTGAAATVENLRILQLLGDD